VSSSPDPEAVDGYEHLIEGPVGSFTRLVVSPDFRGRGLSTEMDRVRLIAAEVGGCRSVVSVAELEFRMNALERMGFRRLGPTKIRYLSYAPSYVLLKRFQISC
jgi:GNAT superfamily N-acetyltransferase